MFKELEVLITDRGIRPYEIWLNSLTLRQKVIIDRYVMRLFNIGLQYNLVKALKNDIFELRIFHGPGFRVYFSFKMEVLILILGGDKSSQMRDIKKAKQLWSNYGQ